MMRSGFLFFSLLMLVLGCKPAEVKVEYKLKDDQLARLMYDIQLGEVTLSELPPLQRDSLRDLFWLRMTEIYKLPEIEIRSEIARLESDPAKMKMVIGQVKELSDSIR
jgi:hypothetical protein